MTCIACCACVSCHKFFGCAPGEFFPQEQCSLSSRMSCSNVNEELSYRALVHPNFCVHSRRDVCLPAGAMLRTVHVRRGARGGNFKFRLMRVLGRVGNDFQRCMPPALVSDTGVMECQPKSNTVTGVSGPVHCKNHFRYLGVENVEMLEICKFVWPNCIFR